MLNYAFYISGKGGRLKTILKEKLELLKKTKIVFSDSKDNIYLKEELLKIGIDYILLDYKEINSEKNNKNLILSNQLLATLKKYKVDYCFSFGAHILKGDLLKVYENKIINFHPALLPNFRGIKAIDQAVKSNSYIIGNTAHFIDKGVDTGPIILQSIQSIEEFYNYGYEKILDTQVEMLKKISMLLEKNRIEIINRKVKIKEANYGKITFYPEI